MNKITKFTKEEREELLEASVKASEDKKCICFYEDMKVDGITDTDEILLRFEINPDTFELIKIKALDDCYPYDCIRDVLLFDINDFILKKLLSMPRIVLKKTIQEYVLDLLEVLYDGKSSHEKTDGLSKISINKENS